MSESLFVLLITMCSTVLFAYWVYWACLLLRVTDMERLAPILNRDYKRLRHF